MQGFCWWALAGTLALTIAGCDLPRDPEDTLQRVRGGVMRVGVCHAEPFVIDAGHAAPTGPEPQLIEDFAASLNARVEWVRSAPDDLLKDLEEFELDAVICGMRKTSPWARRVAAGRPYVNEPEPRVIALPPGENAYLLALDRFIGARSAPNAEGGGP